MQSSRRKFLHLAAAASLTPALPRRAAALDYPTRPIRLELGFTPGGPADTYLTTPMTTDLAANTATSFTTTTTWQAYGGEQTLRYLAQVIGLVAQSFLAGAAGLAI